MPSIASCERLSVKAVVFAPDVPVGERPEIEFWESLPTANVEYEM
jgi:predicted RNA-binding protein with TRAM domain